jgi:threonine synthase
VIDAVSDEQIMEAYRLTASLAGLMCEPASAASIAGIRQRARLEDLSTMTVVAVLTGHGLKDPATALSLFDEIHPVSATVDAVLGTQSVSIV